MTHLSPKELESRLDRIQQATWDMYRLWKWAVLNNVESIDIRPCGKDATSSVEQMAADVEEAVTRKVMGGRSKLKSSILKPTRIPEYWSSVLAEKKESE